MTLKLVALCLLSIYAVMQTYLIENKIKKLDKTHRTNLIELNEQLELIQKYKRETQIWEKHKRVQQIEIYNELEQLPIESEYTSNSKPNSEEQNDTLLEQDNKNGFKILSFYTDANDSDYNYQQLREAFLAHHFLPFSNSFDNDLQFSQSTDIFLLNFVLENYERVYSRLVSIIKPDITVAVSLRKKPLDNDHVLSFFVRLLNAVINNNHTELVKIWCFRLLVCIIFIQKTKLHQKLILSEPTQRVLDDVAQKVAQAVNVYANESKKDSELLEKRELVMLQLLFVSLIGKRIENRKILNMRSNYRLVVSRLLPWCIALSEIYNHRESRIYMIDVTKKLFNTASELSPIVLHEFDMSRLFKYVAERYDLIAEKNINVVNKKTRILLTSSYLFDNSSITNNGTAISPYNTHIHIEPPKITQNHLGGCISKSILSEKNLFNPDSYFELTIDKYFAFFTDTYTVVKRRIFLNKKHVLNSLLVCSNSIVFHHLTPLTDDFEHCEILMFSHKTADFNRYKVDSTYLTRTLEIAHSTYFMTSLGKKNVSLWYSVKFGGTTSYVKTQLYNNIFLTQYDSTSEIFIRIKTFASDDKILILDYLSENVYLVHPDTKKQHSDLNFDSTKYPEILKINNKSYTETTGQVEKKTKSLQPFTTLFAQFDKNILKTIYKNRHIDEKGVYV